MCVSALALIYISEKDIIRAILLELYRRGVEEGREGWTREGRGGGKEIQEQPLGGGAWLALRLKTIRRDPLARGRAV